MKNPMYKTKVVFMILLFLLSNNLFAKKRGDIEKSKSINKNFTVNADQLIELKNKFGKLEITSWDKSEVALNITINVKANDEKKAQEVLDKIKIDISEKTSALSIKTLIGNDQKKIKLNTGKNGEITINYEVKIPRKNKLIAENSFGPFLIDQLNGSANIKVSFGSATIGKLNGIDNVLDFQFSDPVIISEMNTGKIHLQHSKLELLKANKLTLASEMSNSKIDQVESGDINLQFGSADISKVKDLYLTSQMSSVTIKSLHNKGTVKTSYGSFTLLNLMKGATQLTVNGEFSPIKVNLDKATAYQVNASSKMGGLKVPKGSMNELKDDSEKLFNDEKAFKGKIGSSSGNAIPIKINSSFGEVKLGIAD